MRYRLYSAWGLSALQITQVVAFCALTMWFGFFILGGAILLFSGTTPAVDQRIVVLKKLVPLPFLEFSHFIGSVAGMGLLLLGRGLQRRLDAAYHLSVGLLIAGIVASLFKGFDYEESVLQHLILAGKPVIRPKK